MQFSEKRIMPKALNQNKEFWSQDTFFYFSKLDVINTSQAKAFYIIKNFHLLRIFHCDATFLIWLLVWPLWFSCVLLLLSRFGYCTQILKNWTIHTFCSGRDYSIYEASTKTEFYITPAIIQLQIHGYHWCTFLPRQINTKKTYQLSRPRECLYVPNGA